MVTKTLVGHVDNSAYPQITADIQLALTTPAGADGPVPVIMELSSGGFGPGRGAARAPLPAGAAAPGAGRGPAGPTWQQQVLAKGWGYATLNTGGIQADNGAGLTQGIIGLVNKGPPRKLDDWGVLRAWAWGACRALDYFETDKAVDAKRVGLEGHSRWGKATLVGMAYDERFAVAFVSSSGEGGAKLHRRDWGEIVENVAGTAEYHWMAGNFLRYAGPLKWGDLPVDCHELVAMCAPRPVFISAGATNGDGWADANGSFMAAAAAGPVYKLLGKKDMGTPEFFRPSRRLWSMAAWRSASIAAGTLPRRTGRRLSRSPKGTSRHRRRPIAIGAAAPRGPNRRPHGSRLFGFQPVCGCSELDAGGEL